MAKMTGKALLFFAFILPKLLFSYETQPWFGNVYEFETKGSYDYLSSSRMNTKHGTKKKNLWGYLFKENILFTTPAPLSFELELSQAKTSEHNFNFNAAKASVRYKWLDDLVDDNVSLTTGIAITYAPSTFNKDPLIVIRKKFGGEAHISIGKEFGITERRYFSTWGTVLLGASQNASPWGRGELHLGCVYNDKHTVDLFLNGEKGFGEKRIRSTSHFPGYAHLDYRFLDIGLGYTYKTGPDFSIFAKVAKRLHGKYCPTNTTAFSIGIDIPFGI